MGACYASSMSGKDIRSFFTDLSNNRKTVLQALFSARIGRFKDVTSLSNPFLFDSEKLLEQFWPKQVPSTFEELSTPFRAFATDFYNAKSVVFSEGKLLPAVSASIAIPGIFKTVQIDHHIYTDGGTFNPVPFDCFNNELPTLAVDVTGLPLMKEPHHPVGVQILSGAIQLMQNSIIQEKLKQKKPALLIRPPVHRFTVLDFLKTEEILSLCDLMKDYWKRSIAEKLSFIL